MIETCPFVSRTSSANSAENGVGLKYARQLMCFVSPRSRSPSSTAIGWRSSGRLNSSSAKKIGTRPTPRSRAPGHGSLHLVEHGLDLAVRVLTAEVRGCAVDALHRAADARPDRKRVRGRVQRIAARRPAEAEVVCADPVGLSPPDQSRDLAPGRVRTEHGQRFLAGADDAVVDAEELEALLWAGREARSARDEHRLGRHLAQGAPQLEDLGKQEADVDRLVVRRVEPVDHDAVVDDPDPEPDQVGTEGPRRLAGRSERILGDEVRVEELHLGACLLRGRAQPLEPVRRHRRDPLKRVRVNEKDATSAPDCGGRGRGGHGRLSVTPQ